MFLIHRYKSKAVQAYIKHKYLGSDQIVISSWNVKWDKSIQTIHHTHTHSWLEIGCQEVNDKQQQRTQNQKTDQVVEKVPHRLTCTAPWLETIAKK